MLVAVAAGAAISAAVAMLVRARRRLASPPPRMSVFWRSWWLGDLAGGLVVLPLALAWARPASAGRGGTMAPRKERS